MYMITKDYFKAGTRYESPVSEVFSMHTEGVLCASTQFFNDETDWSSMWG